MTGPRCLAWDARCGLWWKNFVKILAWRGWEERLMNGECPALVICNHVRMLKEGAA